MKDLGLVITGLLLVVVIAILLAWTDMKGTKYSFTIPTTTLPFHPEYSGEQYIPTWYSVNGVLVSGR